MQRRTKLRLHRTDDELVRDLATGDLTALVEIDARYRRRLVAHARSLTGRSIHDAEDVVQDVLLKAHAEIVAGRGPRQLMPWLFGITRNRAIDETRRARWGHGSLDALEPAQAIDALADIEDPPAVLHRRESLRTIVQDLSDLPVAQRGALLSRVIDGDSPSESAQRLGLTVEAVQMLVVRGRRNLEKVRAARRARGDVDAQLMALASPTGLLGVVGATKLLTAGGGKLVVAGVTGLAAAAATVGGFVIVSSSRAGPGQPAPFLVQGANQVAGHHIRRGQPLPANTAVVGLELKVPAGPLDAAHRTLTLQCPTGMRYAAWIPRQQDAIVFEHHMDLEPADPLGAPRADGKATFVLRGRELQTPQTVSVLMLCRTPGPESSLVEHPRLRRPGEGSGVTCRSGTMNRSSAGRPVSVGLIAKGEHVAVTAQSGDRVRVVEQTHWSGWIRSALLCAGWTRPRS